MKLVKKTDEYTIYQRRDERYAVQDADKNPVNGAEKVRILVEEDLIKAAVPAAQPAGEATEATAADEEAAAEAPVAEEAPAEEASDEEDK